MKDKSKLPASVRKLPKVQQAKALLHAAIGSKMMKDAGRKVPVPGKE